MSPVLDVVIYRGTYADLEEAFGDDWDAYVDHYFTYGIKEGRYNGTGFDLQYYLNSYADLKAAFGDDLVAAANHYIEYGYNESRTQIQKPTPVVPSAPSTTTVVKDGTIYIYDANEKILKKIYPDGRCVDYEYDANGKMIKSTDSDGFLMDYDAEGKEIKRTLPNGDWEEYEYDANKRRSKITYSNGTWRIYEYDANGNQYKNYYYGTSGKIECVMESLYTADGIWLGEKEIQYYDYETNKISRIIEWDNTGEIISDVSYNEDGTVRE